MNSEWNRLLFSDNNLLTIQDGDRGKNYPKKNEFSTFGHCIFLNTSNVRKDGFKFENLDFITAEKDKLLRKGKLEREDIVLTTRGTVGNVGYFDKNIKYSNIRINSGMVILRPNRSNLEPEFLYQFVKSKIFDNQVKSLTSGSAQPQLPIRDLKNVFVDLPPLQEQKRIAHILGTLDDKIELNRKMNETLEAMAQALFKSWFVDFDPVIDNALAAGNEIPEQFKERARSRSVQAKKGKFNHLFPSSFTFNETLNKWIPEGWEVCQLESITEKIVDCLHSKKPDDKGIGKKMLQVFNIGLNGRLDWSKKYFVNDDDFKIWNKRISPRKGDIFVTKTGRVGAIGQLLSNEKITFGRNIVLVRPSKRFPMFILGTALNSNYAKTEIERNTTDGTILKSLHVKHLNKLRFIVPSKSNIQVFEKSFEVISEKLHSNDKQIHKLIHLRDTLLPKLISGKLELALTHI